MNKGVIIVFLILASLHVVYAQSSVAILTSDNAADYAVARVWANKIGATVVVTPWGSLTSDAVNEILFSQAPIVYVVGGEVAIPNAEGKLAGYDKTVIRAGGANRQETSLAVAEKFGATRAVVLDGYDAAAMEEAVTVGVAESTPIIFLRHDDSGFGAALRDAGIDDVTLISNPSITEEVKESIKAEGIKLTEPAKDRWTSAQRMIEVAESQINETESLVRSIKDGPTLAAASLLVKSKISLSNAKERLAAMDYGGAFLSAVEAEELSRFGKYVYNGRYAGNIRDMVDKANSDISTMGVDGAKDALRSAGSPYGIGLPVPPSIDLESYMVDIPGYTKSQVGAGIEYDMSARYTKKIGQTVIVEIYKRADDADAINWVEQVQFSPGVQSRDWESTTFMGYPANVKSVTYTASDNMNQEVFLRVAVGNLGVFSKFTQSVRKSDAPTLLLHPDVAQAMVDEVTAGIIKAIESSQ